MQSLTIKVTDVDNIIIKPGDTLLPEEFNASWIGKRLQLKSEGNKKEGWIPHKFIYIWTYTTNHTLEADLEVDDNGVFEYKLHKRISKSGHEKVENCVRHSVWNTRTS